MLDLYLAAVHRWLFRRFDGWREWTEVKEESEEMSSVLDASPDLCGGGAMKYEFRRCPRCSSTRYDEEREEIPACHMCGVEMTIIHYAKEIEE